MNLVKRMVEHYVWLVGELIASAESLSDEQLDGPIVLPFEGIDDDPTIRSLMSRLIGQMDMWNSVIAGSAYDWSVEDGESITSMRSRLDRAGSGFLDEVHRVVEEARLDETFIDAHSEPVEVFTYGALIAHVCSHSPPIDGSSFSAPSNRPGSPRSATATPGNGWPEQSDRFSIRL